VDVINRAKNGIYPINFASKIDIKFLKKYCLEGHNTQNGFFMIDDYLRHKCSFLNANLMKPLPSNLGQFDVIFLRNMLIYFDIANKKIIVENIIKLLKSGGYLFIGHSETLTNVTTQVRQVKPTIYIKD
jgi:chemotaxis protein methyltransferase CheR